MSRIVPTGEIYNIDITKSQFLYIVKFLVHVLNTWLCFDFSIVGGGDRDDNSSEKFQTNWKYHTFIHLVKLWTGEHIIMKSYRCLRSSSKIQHTSSDTTRVAVFHPLLSCQIEFLSALRTSLCQPYSHNQTHNSKGEYWSLTFLLLNDDNSHNH